MPPHNDAEQTANVFAVMEAILSSTATDDQTISDQAAVQTILDATTKDSYEKTVAELYQSYLDSKQG